MNLKRLILTLAATMFPAVVVATPVAFGQGYPSRPITMIVPFPPGGPTDTIARILAEHMKASLGHTVVVENISGAGGTIGVGRVARAPSDGYTAIVGDWTSHVSSPAILTVQFDVLRDFEPVALLTSAPQLFVGKSTMPANNLGELIAWLKANPDKAAAALPGTFGSGGHISGLYFQKITGTRFQFVPYRGGAPAIQDVVAGHIDLSFGEASTALPHVRSGKIKAYGVTSKNRWAAAPDIPTMDEAGAPGLFFSLWRGLWLPKGTPKEVVARLNSAVVEAFHDAAVQQRITELGQDIPPRDQQTPEAFRVYHQAEIDKWWPIIKAANIKVE